MSRMAEMPQKFLIQLGDPFGVFLEEGVACVGQDMQLALGHGFRRVVRA